MGRHVNRVHFVPRLIATVMLASLPLTAWAAPDPLINLTFDPSTAPPAGELGHVSFETQFDAPDFVQGVRGRAWRSDGFSSSLSVPLALPANRGFSVEGWVALESFPSDREVPVDELRPASLMNQATRDKGFDLSVDMFGRWAFRVSTSTGQRRVSAPDSFPLGRWVHVAATFDPASGEAILYLEGKAIGRTATGAGSFVPASTDFRVARSWEDAEMGMFRVNGLNAAFDDIRVYDHSLSAREIERDATSVVPPSASGSLMVPASRFASELQRPAYHAMPPANWTNEPHGMVRRGDQWHLFYQRTPNGPYKTEMHWGHMSSGNLVDWTYLPDALRPTLQTDSFGFDMKGIWSGDVVLGPHDAAYAFYTSVNHSPTIFNPGISVAVSTDPDLRTWHKRGPVINAEGLRDFRDPFVWHEGTEWRMIVGAAMPGHGGGVAYYRCADIDDIHCWKRQPKIASFGAMDVGSDIWEMPVFEPIGHGKQILLANPIGGSVSKYGQTSTRAVYWIGTWDGRQFKPDTLQPKMLDLVPGHLSPTVDRDAGGALVGIGIVDERRSTAAQKRAGWAHVFSLPRVWRLLGDGETLGQSPWPGLAKLRDTARSVDRLTAPSTPVDRLKGDLGPAVELIADFGEQRPITPYGVYIATSSDDAETTRVSYDPTSHRLIVDKSHSTLSDDGEGPMILTGAYDEAAFGVPRTFHVFVDHSVVDVFINDAAAFSFRIYPSRPDSTHFGIVGKPDVAGRLRAWAMRASSFVTDVAAR